MYECHHPSMDSNPLFERILSQCLISNISNFDGTKEDAYALNPFTFDASKSKYRALRQLIYQTLKQQSDSNGTRRWNLPTIYMHSICFLVTLLWTLSFLYLCHYPTITAAVVCGLAMNPLNGIAHNFMHQADHLGWHGIESYWRYRIFFKSSCAFCWKSHDQTDHKLLQQKHLALSF